MYPLRLGELLCYNWPLCSRAVRGWHLFSNLWRDHLLELLCGSICAINGKQGMYPMCHGLLLGDLRCSGLHELRRRNLWSGHRRDELKCSVHVVLGGHVLGCRSKRLFKLRRWVLLGEFRTLKLHELRRRHLWGGHRRDELKCSVHVVLGGHVLGCRGKRLFKLRRWVLLGEFWCRKLHELRQRHLFHCSLHKLCNLWSWDLCALELFQDFGCHNMPHSCKFSDLSKLPT
jgi:hypothetical protein